MEERREDLNEEQRGRPLRSRGEKAFERLHPNRFRPLRRAMSSLRQLPPVSRRHDGRGSDGALRSGVRC